MRKINYTDNDGNRVTATINDIGMIINEQKITSDVQKMMSPVTCSHCGQTYDLADAKVVHNYGDCTMFRTPCCDVLADDRAWKSFPDFKRIELTDTY